MSIFRENHIILAKIVEKTSRDSAIIKSEIKLEKMGRNSYGPTYGQLNIKNVPFFENPIILTKIIEKKSYGVAKMILRRKLFCMRKYYVHV
jgi:hypothetical protein